MTSQGKQNFARIIALGMENLHYLGLILVVILMIEGHQSAGLSKRSLEDSVNQQEVLRNVLWVNLLTQRATLLALSPWGINDPISYDKAIKITQSLPRFIHSTKPTKSNDEAILKEKVAKIQDLFESLKTINNSVPASKDLSQFLDQIARIGEALNEQESTSWYALLEKNQSLLVDLKSSQRTSYFTYILFVFYLGFLGYLSARERKAAQKLQLAESKLVNVAKMSALGEMAGGVAHEINNPLAAIKILMGQIGEIVDDVPLDRALLKKMASKAEITTDRIAEIVCGLRSFSRDGSNDPNQGVDIRQLIHETLSFCNARFTNNGTQVKIEDVAPDLCFEGRPTEISQVLLNLLNNAHDAIGDHKEKWIHISATDQDRWIEIRVTDSGKGIPEEIQRKLFQPFFTTKEIGKGTGLGLSISLGIVQNHGGTLQLDNHCSNTCFVIRLPKKQDLAVSH